jgi:hypothetical protein
MIKMKSILRILVIILVIILFYNCKKEEDKPTVPVVATTTISDITQISANSGGNVIDDGGAEVSARGVCWTTTYPPTISESKTSDGTGTGGFTSYVTGLTPMTKYYISAYATNSVGTGYGNEYPQYILNLFVHSL